MNEKCPFCGADNRSCGTYREHLGNSFGNTTRLVQSPACRILELTAERDAALLGDELLDLMHDFHLGIKEWRGGKWTIETNVMPVLAWSREAGPWNSPRECLAACRDWVLSPDGPGWENRPTKNGVGS